MSDVPYGVLLSGGLDSSIISAIAAPLFTSAGGIGDNQEAWWPRLHSFAVGLKDSPDLEAPGGWPTILTPCITRSIFTIEEGLDAIRMLSISLKHMMLQL